MEESGLPLEEYVRSLVLPMSEPQLEDRIDHEWDTRYHRFCGALACAFGLEPMLVGHLANLDYICVPAERDDQISSPTYRQLLCMEATIDPIDELLGYLFDYKDPFSGEIYEHSDYVKVLLRQTIEKIAKQHEIAGDYFVWISKRLGQSDDYLSTNYAYYLERLDTHVAHYRGGVKGYVFDKIVNNVVIYCR